MLGVPLISEDELIGVVHVGRLDGRPFRQEDAVLLEVAAGRVAGAITGRRLAVEAAASDLLERSLMPSSFPRLPGVEFAGRYIPVESRRAGGDWYDTFAVPTGKLWLVTGDVVGHGLNAAVVMGRVRNAIRSYALLGGGPAQVLELTDSRMQYFEEGIMATVLAAVAEPPYNEFLVCGAGHPPPILAQPGRETEVLEIDAGPPLGTFAGVTRAETTVSVPLGGVLLLYTDGLVERHGESIYEGIERLRAATNAEHPEVVCRSVMHQLVGREQPFDDIAALAIRHTATADTD
jgi:serine phosphatase RsbU (regulator of sigma subunit)